ncbi:hypothetical protein HMF8227_00517 [Saliniradius amylolyticus]|uniref:Uncharacterized protein n=1 Tax=Saliniradius amylolyticus TaxID=2183582 RepID=A0A2S2E072_9ALTE|nr:hypothetical protein [Saliniradius amylolyticus]AWL11013.1 hypothetical protein HMF8227_00517 [Saliniradius amylolyticus]
MSDPQLKKLLEHPQLTHSENRRVISHVQREDGDWYLHTLMLEGVDTPFKFRRKKPYQSLQGARVNLTYYPDTESVAGLDFDIMKVVRLRRA